MIPVSLEKEWEQKGLLLGGKNSSYDILVKTNGNK